MLALLIPGLGMGAGTAPNLVEVPDVVGETQAAGTATLEGDGFVVSVETAYNAAGAGLIFDQSPDGGTFALLGSTVTIYVSLGPQPVSDEQPTGGWLFLNEYERELRRRKRRERERRELEEETERIQDALDREIAQLLREQEAKDERRAELQRLKELARKDANIAAARRYSESVAKALEAAIVDESLRAIARLEKELKKAREQEEHEFLLLASSLLLH